MYVIFDRASLTAKGVALDNCEEGTIAFPVSRERYIELVNNPRALRHQVLVTGEGGKLTMVEQEDLTASSRKMFQLPKTDKADAVLVVRRQTVSLLTSSAYPKDKVHRFYALLDGNPLTPLTVLDMSPGVSVQMEYLLKPEQLTSREDLWNRCTICIDNPYEEYSYGCNIDMTKD